MASRSFSATSVGLIVVINVNVMAVISVDRVMSAASHNMPAGTLEVESVFRDLRQ